MKVPTKQRKFLEHVDSVRTTPLANQKLNLLVWCRRLSLLAGAAVPQALIMGTACSRSAAICGKRQPSTADIADHPQPGSSSAVDPTSPQAYSRPAGASREQDLEMTGWESLPLSGSSSAMKPTSSQTCSGPAAASEEQHLETTGGE